MKFDDWLYETENFSLRLELLLDDVQTDNSGKLIKWLEAAFEAGYSYRETEFMGDSK